MLYTAVFTRIVGNEQITTEVPCPNIDTFWRTTDFFNAHCGTRRFNIVISHCPYGMICSAQRKGEYVFATLHRNEGAHAC